MKINELKTIYICPDHNEKYHARKVYMDELLTSYGFKNFSHFKSGNERYPVCLSVATKDILLANMDEPILVLEDDVEITDVLDFDIDMSADAIYFGFSICAGHPTLNKNTYYSKFEPYNESQVRVMNMLGTHAILYISKAYKEAIIRDMDFSIQSGFHNDVVRSRNMPMYRILANKKPSFFQSSKFNLCGDPTKFDVELATKVQIVDGLRLVNF